MAKNTIFSLKKCKDLRGKRVFLRCDFNVPVKDGKIMDDSRILSNLPTIRFLLRYKCRIILATHFGQPKGKDKKYSTKIISDYLSKILNRNIIFMDSCYGGRVSVAVSKMEEGDILFLENLRFEEGEEKNDPVLAKRLAGLAQIYVNNAFGVSHRVHASVSAIKKYLPSYAGLLLEDEVVNLNKILNPKKPLISVIGGAKIGTKIKLIKNLLKKSEEVLIGGALANNFFVAHKLAVGKSLVDLESVKIAEKLKSKNIILPIDAIVSNKIDGGEARIKKITDIGPDEIILDIGPKTIKLFANYIKKANSIIWNGPLGMFENEHYKHGTIAVASVIASRSRGKAFGAVGGGETIEALKQTKMEDYIDWVSSGGGAMLSYLGGEKMPGLEGLIK